MVTQSTNTPLLLSGMNFTLRDSPLEWIVVGDPEGTSAQLPGSGSLPPCTYKSSRPDVASVDNLGVVRSVWNGTAEISVADAAGNTQSFKVTVENVYRILYNPTLLTWQETQHWIKNVDGIPFDKEVDKYLGILRAKYRATKDAATSIAYGTGQNASPNPDPMQSALVGSSGPYDSWWYGHGTVTNKPLPGLCYKR